MSLADLLKKKAAEAGNATQKDSNSGVQKELQQGAIRQDIPHQNVSAEIGKPASSPTAGTASSVASSSNTVKPGAIKLNLKLPAAAPMPVGSVAGKAAEVEKPTNPSQVSPSAAAISAENFNHPDMVEKLAPGDVNAFKEAISILHSSFEHPELVSNATRNILVALRENAEFKDLLQPADFQLMIRALRESHGLVVSSKVNNKQKKAKTAAQVDEIAEMIGDIEFET